MSARARVTREPHALHVVVDELPGERALLRALHRWASSDARPPDSRYPRLADKTLVAAGQCTKVDRSASPVAVGLLGCGVMAGLGATAPQPAAIPLLSALFERFVKNLKIRRTVTGLGSLRRVLRLDARGIQVEDTIQMTGPGHVVALHRAFGAHTSL